jgi:hypothetical protein
MGIVMMAMQTIQMQTMQAQAWATGASGDGMWYGGAEAVGAATVDGKAEAKAGAANGESNDLDGEVTSPEATTLSTAELAASTETETPDSRVRDPRLQRQRTASLAVNNDAEDPSLGDNMSLSPSASENSLPKGNTSPNHSG